MKIVFREGEALILAETDELAVRGSTLTARLRSGKTVNFPFPDPDVLEQFFEEVILTAGEKPVRLEQTNFDLRLGQLLDDWDSLYEDIP